MYGSRTSVAGRLWRIIFHSCSWKSLPRLVLSSSRFAARYSSSGSLDSLRHPKRRTAGDHNDVGTDSSSSDTHGVRPERLGVDLRLPTLSGTSRSSSSSASRYHSLSTSPASSYASLSSSSATSWAASSSLASASSSLAPSSSSSLAASLPRRKFSLGSVQTGSQTRPTQQSERLGTRLTSTGWPCPRCLRPRASWHCRAGT